MRMFGISFQSTVMLVRSDRSTRTCSGANRRNDTPTRLTSSHRRKNLAIVLAKGSSSVFIHHTAVAWAPSQLIVSPKERLLSSHAPGRHYGHAAFRATFRFCSRWICFTRHALIWYGYLSRSALTRYCFQRQPLSAPCVSVICGCVLSTNLVVMRPTLPIPWSGEAARLSM